MRVVLFANTDWYLYNFRLALAEGLRAAGHEVVLISPDGEWGPRLRGMGFDWRPITLSRRGMNPLAELVVIGRLRKLYAGIAPDVVHHFTIKCVLYGSFAARWAGVARVVNSITGLGHMLESNALRARLLRPAVLALYRLALRGTAVIFQNRDNRALFDRLGLLRGLDVHLVPGSGVALDRFSIAPPPAELPPVVLMVGRLLHAKGVACFVAAARRVRAQRPDVEFWLAGDRDEGNPGCVTAAELAAWSNEGAVQFLGHRDDVAALNSRASMAVLPSHGEGLPRTLIEAAASARPLLASNVPGCREIVRDGVNGYLFERDDDAALAERVLELLAKPDRARQFGLAARVDAERIYSDTQNVAATVAAYLPKVSP